MKATDRHPWVRETMAKLHLSQVAPPPMEAWWLRATNGSYTHATLVVFTPVGVMLTGDLVLCEQSRAVIALGYHKDWWLSRLDDDYLASKFLSRGYFPKQVGHHAMVMAIEHRRERGIEAEEARALYDAGKRCIDDHEMGPVFEAYYDALGDSMSPEHDENAVAWLAGVHTRFRECWAEIHPVPAEAAAQ